VTRLSIDLIVPGPLDQQTGGYLYDARMVTELRERGWTVHVHSLEGRFPDPDSVAEESLESTLAARPEGSLILLDGLGVGALPNILARHRGRLRLLALVHHPLGDETGLDSDARQRFLALEADALKHCLGIVVTSAFTADRLHQMGVDPSRIQVAPPGTRRVIAAREPREAQSLSLLCVATVIPRKGHDVLIEALAPLRDLPWTLSLAGSLDRDPRYVDSLRTQVHELHLDDRIHFLGECSEDTLDRLYRQASLFVLASHYEGFGMVLTEALAHGLPILSTRGGAIPSTVPEDAALLVAPGQAAVLSGALRHLLTSPAERTRRSDAARAHARTLPDWPEAAAQLERALFHLLQENPHVG